jgi:protein ImuB
VIRELSGASARPLKVRPEMREFVRRIVFEDPIDDLGNCLAAAESGLDELLGEVIRFGLAVSMIEIVFRDHDRDNRRIMLKLPVPSANLRFIVKLLHYEAETLESSAPVRAIEVRLQTAPPRRVQLSFWHPPFPDAERLELTLGRLRRLLGEQNVGVPSMRDSYNPRDFLIDAEARPSSVDTGVDESEGGYLVLRFFEPPRPVVFRHSVDDPRYLEIDRRWQKIRRIGGPWLSSGEWWNDGSFWRRREMDVELVGGQVFRVVDDGCGDFFAEGYYD